MPISFDRRNQRWRFRFNRVLAGRRFRASRLLPQGWTRAQADKFDQAESARLYALATGVGQQRHLIDQAVLLYLQERAPSLKSFKNIQREMALFMDAYTGRRIEDLAAVAREYATAQAGVLSPATIRNRLAYLRAACRYAWKHHNMGDHDPAERMAMPKVRNERHVYIGRLEMIKIARACTHQQARMAIRIAFYSGMRLGEILSATVAGNVWVLVNTKNDTPRLVPIHPAVAVCARHFKGAPKITIQRAWERARDRCGYADLHFHDLRHSAASAMVNQGIDLYTVGKVLGHKDQRSTNRYAHLAIETLVDAVGRIGKKRDTTTNRQSVSPQKNRS